MLGFVDTVFLWTDTGLCPVFSCYEESFTNIMTEVILWTIFLICLGNIGGVEILAFPGVGLLGHTLSVCFGCVERSPVLWSHRHQCLRGLLLCSLVTV